MTWKQVGELWTAVLNRLEIDMATGCGEAQGVDTSPPRPCSGGGGTAADENETPVYIAPRTGKTGHEASGQSGARSAIESADAETPASLYVAKKSSHAYRRHMPAALSDMPRCGPAVPPIERRRSAAGPHLHMVVIEAHLCRHLGSGGGDFVEVVSEQGYVLFFGAVIADERTEASDIEALITREAAQENYCGVVERDVHRVGDFVDLIHLRLAAMAEVVVAGRFREIPDANDLRALHSPCRNPAHDDMPILVSVD